MKKGSPSVPMPGYRVKVLDEGGHDDPRRRDRALDVSAYPLLVELRPLLEGDRCEEEFRAGLQALLDRLRPLSENHPRG